MQALRTNPHLGQVTGAADPTPTLSRMSSPADVLPGLRFHPTHRFRPTALVAPGFVAHEPEPLSPDGLVLAGSGPAAPFAAVQADVRLEPRTTGTAARVELGLATPDGDDVLATWSARSPRWRSPCGATGAPGCSATAGPRWRASFRLAFALCENQVTVLADDGDGWKALLTERTRVAARVDLRREDVLAAHRYTWGGAGVRLTDARAGFSG